MDEPDWTKLKEWRAGDACESDWQKVFCKIEERGSAMVGGGVKMEGENSDRRRVLSDVIRASSSYLKRWIANDAAFIEKQKWLITKIQRRQPLWLNDSLFVSSVHPSPFLGFSRALRARHYFSLRSHSIVLRRLYIALCLLMPDIILAPIAIASYIQSTAITLIS